MKPGLSANKPLLAAIVGVAMLACSGGSGSGGNQSSGGSGGATSGSSGPLAGSSATAGTSGGAGSAAKGGASSSVGANSSGGAGSSGGASTISSSSKPPEGGSSGGRSETGGSTSTGGRTGTGGQAGGTGGSGTSTGNTAGTGTTGGTGGGSAKGGQGGGAGTGSAGSAGGSTYTGGRTAATRPIAFGTFLNAPAVIASAQALAKSASNPSSSQWQAKGDQHRKYRNTETNKDEPYRLYVPTNWDGKAQLPLVMFLHGSGSDENSYIDSNSKQLITLAQEHGYILVGPSGIGTQGPYGNFLRLSAPFGNQAAADQLMAQVTADSERTNEQSEQDVINVLELVLNEYPVDRGAVFLAGHSMGSGGTWLIGGKYSSYWTAFAPLSGPFVQEKGYPWDDLKTMPIFVTEGTLAPSVDGSHVLRDWLKKNNFKAEYKEVEADHGGMIPKVLPDIFDFFERSKKPL